MLLVLAVGIQPNKWLSLTLGLLAGLYGIAVPTGAHQDQIQQAIEGELKPGQSITKKIDGGKSRSFVVSLQSDHFLRLLVRHRGIILRVALYDPARNLVVEMPNPSGGHGRIYVSEIAAVSGEYRIDVRSTESWSNPGDFEISIDALRLSQPGDEQQVAAERSFAKAVKDDAARSFKTALEEYEKSLKYWREVPDRHWEALTLLALAQTYYKSSNLKLAEEYFSHSLMIEVDDDDWRIKAAALNDLGLVNAQTRNNEKAISLLEQSLGLFESHGDRRGQASSLSNLAMTFGRMGESRRALELAERAVPLRQAENFQAGVNSLLNTIGNIYGLLGEPYKSLDSYNRALGGWRALAKANELDSPDRLANALNSVALANDRIGEWHKATQYYDDALTVPKISIPLRAAILNNKAGLYAALSDFDAAANLCDEARRLLESLERPDPDIMASVILQTGQILVANNQPDAAKKQFQRARDIKPNDPKLAYILTALGDVLSRQGNLTDALKAYSEALEIELRIGDRRSQAVTRQKLGEAYAASKNEAAALKEFDSALSLWRAVVDRPGEATTLNSIAALERDRGNFRQALQKNNEAIEIVESLRTNLSNYQLRTSYFASQGNYYELNFDLNMLLYQQDNSRSYLNAALEASEKSRARTLIDTLAENRDLIAQNVNADLINLNREVERKLRAKLEAQTILLSGRHQPGEANAIAKEVADLIRQHDEIRGQIRSGNPNHAGLNQPALSATELQQQLDAGTLLLEFALGEKRSYVWAVTPETIRGFELPPRQQIESTAGRLLQAIATRSRVEPDETSKQRLLRWDQADKEFAETALSLSRMLLDPVASLLGQKRLVLVADGALQLVPFAGLPDPAELSSALLAKHEIVSLPSASVLAVQRRELANRKPAPLSLAVLADPVFSIQDERVVRAISSTKRKDPATPKKTPQNNQLLALALRDVGLDPGAPLRRLTKSRAEALDISRLVPSDQFFRGLDFQASRAIATSGLLSKYRYLHFATHGVVNLEHPELSGIVLSMFDEKGQPLDGYLRLYEIYNLNLPAELVVLSACQTGAGKQIRGEGLIALTRGFMHAGAARVVASLWKVDDAATAELMARFYKEMITNGKRPAAALRDAQIELSKERRWQAPYYWAGFVLQGEWR